MVLTFFHHFSTSSNYFKGDQYVILTNNIKYLTIKKKDTILTAFLISL